MDSSEQDKIAQFSAITGANPSVAQNALNAANGDLEQAVGLYFAENEGEAEDDDEDLEDASAQPAATQSTSSTGRNPRGGGGNKPKQMTLRDLQGGDDDDDEEEKNQDMFAGGEKSGLAVQNPNEASGGPVDHFKNIMNQARQNRDRPPGASGEEDDEPRSSAFTGRAQTLGGDDAPSRVFEDPRAALQQRQRLPRVTRTLHLWADGVSIDDGPLLRFDDPANDHIMQEINQGRAPKALLNVQPDQEVDLNLEPHKGEDYVAPKPKYKPFGGQGQRLGSPTPGIGSSAPAATPSGPPPAASSAATSSSVPSANIDESQPTVQLQIRLGDGTRLSSRFNTTQNMGDVYDFVNRASPESLQRPYVLMTTFPSRELSDKSQVLGDMNDFKRGGVVVQKWK